MMEASKAKVFAATVVISLLIILVLLWLSLGLSETFFILASICLFFILLVFFWVLSEYSALDNRRRLSILRRSSPDSEQVLRQEYSFLRKVAGLPSNFKYSVLAAATDNFQSPIGRGSSASVFKGILDDGTAVAVKRIETASEQGDREFRSEVCTIGAVQHLNLVRLLGYCLVPGSGPRFLVYDFVYNGSLDKWLFPKSAKRQHNHIREGAAPVLERYLPWAMRYRIAIDVAKGLSYLHHDCRCRILHLDVKPENILLDENFRACLADFGLSKLMSRDESRVVTTVRGTRGYLAPEWLLERGVTEKSDVYSYGMVLLELVGGRRNVRLVGDQGRNRKWSYFPRIVAEKAREGRVMEVVDERLIGKGVEEKEVKLLVWVALWCIQEECQLRPSMARVVDMLEGRIPVERPPETDMVVVDLLGIDEESTPANGGMAQRMEQQNRLEMSMSNCSIALSVMSGR